MTSIVRISGVACALFLGIGCQYGFTLPSSDPAPSGPLAPGQTLPIRLRRSILPGHVTGPPPPDAGITAEKCGTMTDGGPLGSDNLTTGTLSCDQTVVGKTTGGVTSNQFSSRFYEKDFCTPRTYHHDRGPERIYRLDIEEQTRAIVTLDTPCGDLDMAAALSNSDNVPGIDTNISRCEENRKDGTKREQVDLFNQHASTWWIVIEPVDDDGDTDGEFALTVQCEHGLVLGE